MLSTEIILEVQDILKKLDAGGTRKTRNELNARLKEIYADHYDLFTNEYPTRTKET